MIVDKKNTRAYSGKQESIVAKQLGGKKVANSGATQFQKGDVRTDIMLIECKTSTEEKKSFSIKREWLTKLREEAFSMGKRFYALAFNYGGFGNTENYYIIDSNTMRQLQEYLRSLEE